MRSAFGAEARLCRAVHTASLTSGVTRTPSLVSSAVIHCRAKAISPGSSMRASGCRESVPSRPSSMLSPPMASAAARAERPRSNRMTCAPMKRRNCRASSASSTDLPAPVGPTISVWPTSPTCRSSRNGVLPRVSVIISGGAFRCRLACRPRPHRRHRHHVSEVQGVHDRLAHIGVGVAGQTARARPRRRSRSRGW